MVTLEKSGDSAVKFVFTDSDHYLYGDGEVVVPVNSLSLVIDESEMVTFKKAATADPFISFRADNSNLGTKAAIEQFYKENMVGSTGGGSESGMTPSEVQEMIDESISGKADASDVTAVASDVQTVSGQVATKVAITDFNAYSAATDARLAEDEEVTAAALNNLDETKQDALVYYSESTEEGWADIHMRNDDGEGNVDEYSFNVGTGSVDLGHYNQYDDGQGNSGYTSTQIQLANPELILSSESEENGETEFTDFKITPTGVTINDERVLTEGNVDNALNSGSTNPVANSAITQALNAKADASALNDYYTKSEVYNKQEVDAAYGTAYQALTAHTADTTVHVSQAEKDIWNAKVDTSAITSSITSGSTDAEIPTAKATYDAIQAGGGGGATYSAGTNISIDTANTINCTLNLRNGTQTNSLTGVQGEANAQDSFAFGNASTAGTNRLDNYAFAFGNNCKARKARSFAYGATIDVKEIDSAAFGQLITLNAPRSFSAGYHNVTNNWANIALGEELTTNNRPEFATGAYNNSVTGSTASGQTLFSVGNGTSSARHNAFEIRQNGDIYVNDGTNDVRLQDTILALGGLKLVKLTQSEYDQLATKDPDTLYIITNVVS